jgi:hypothetical protein
MKEMKVSRRKFLTGSAATAAGAAVASSGISLLSERAEAFFNAGAFWKKPAGSGQTSNGYTIGQSLRFSWSNSTYLAQSQTTAGNAKTHTFSFWMKPAVGTYTQERHLIRGMNNTSGSGSNYSRVHLLTDDTLSIGSGDGGGGALYQVITTRKFRDPSAWYNITVVIDTTQAVNSDRVRLYVNGTRETSFSTATFPGQNTSDYFFQGSGSNLWIGRWAIGDGDRLFDGYLAEFYVVDGQALDSSYFGQTDTNSGQWIPKAYSGSYGTNGFYLKFADNSNTTAATLGKDSSPNSNNWTPTNFNTHDQVLDSPTNNFCTLNPLDKYQSWSPVAGNLSVSTSTNDTLIRSTYWLSSGKWYWEVTYPAVATGIMVGVGNPNSPLSGTNPHASTNLIQWGGSSASLYGFYSGYLGTPVVNANDVVKIAFDADSGKIWFGLNGSWFSGDPASGSTPAVSGFSTGAPWTPVADNAGSTDVGKSLIFNFGQGGQTGLTYYFASGGRFKYTPPAGFKALCTANLPAPTIKQPSQYFSAVTYTGTGATQSIGSLSFQPDFVWIKSRSNPGTHNYCLFDSVRGATKYLSSNSTAIQTTDANTLTSFNSNGFSLGTDGSSAGVNISGETYIAWSWKAGGSAVTNNAGTITSQVSANPTLGFSVVTYTGTGSAATVGHGLGAPPAFIIARGFDNATTTHFVVYHQGLNGGVNPYNWDIFLERNDAASNYSGMDWSSAPTSTVFSVGGGASNTNYSGIKQIAYVWAEIAGFSKFGSYTSNGSSDGPFVYCGFKPRYVIIKSTSLAQHWQIFDSARSPSNLIQAYLHASAPDQEYSGNGRAIDFVSNGFKLRSNDNALNASGTYIFAAFAEAPFKYATAK